MILFLVAAVLAGAALALFVTAGRDRRTWSEHRRQVMMIRRWERARDGAPCDQAAPPRPELDSPYAKPRAENPPVVPDRPGQTRLLWGALLVVCAVLVFTAALAA